MMLEIHLSRGSGGGVGYPINWFNPAIICACPNSESGFQSSYVMVYFVLNDLMCELVSIYKHDEITRQCIMK